MPRYHPPSPDSSDTHPFARKHILLVDDDPGLRATAAFLLVQEGHEVKQANDGRQALQMVLSSDNGNNCYDLIITDVLLPNFSGLELLKNMRARGILIPVLVIAGFLDAAIIEKLYAMKPLKFILKPFNNKDFIGYVKEIISADLQHKTQQGELPCRT